MRRTIAQPLPRRGPITGRTAPPAAPETEPESFVAEARTAVRVTPGPRAPRGPPPPTLEIRALGPDGAPDVGSGVHVGTGAVEGDFGSTGGFGVGVGDGV